MKYLRHTKGIISFGENLRKIRLSKKMSQEQLAYKVGVETSQIGRIERGKIQTSISMVFYLSEALEIPTKKLFDFEIKR